MDFDFSIAVRFALEVEMKKLGRLEFFWAILIVITLFNTFLGEQFASTALVSVLVSITVMYKGLVVIDYFMAVSYTHLTLPTKRIV